MYTTQLSTDRTWISDPMDPGGASIVCGSRAEAISDALDGDTYYYAGGLVEGTARPQDTRTYPVVLAHLSAAAYAQFLVWRGRTVLVRTIDGERFFGYYLSMETDRVLRTTPDDDIGTTTYDVSITFTRVSFDETLVAS
jgi:hypothetical protein